TRIKCTIIWIAGRLTRCRPERTRSLFLRVITLERPDTLEPHQLIQFLEGVEFAALMRSPSGLAEFPVDAAQCSAAGQKARGWEDRNLVPELFEYRLAEDRGAPAFNHVRKERGVERRCDSRHLVLALRGLDEQDVGARLEERFCAPQ